MRYLPPILMVCAALLVSGCQTGPATNDASKCGSDNCGQSPPAAKAPPAPDRLDELQTRLDQERDQAEQAQQQVVQVMQKLPRGRRASAGELRLADVNITDNQSGQTRAMHALQSVSVTMPLAAKGRPEYTDAMDALKKLANTLADARGSAQIEVDQSAADVRARRVNTATGVTQTSNGNPVSVRKHVDRALPAGVERYTIQAGPLHDLP